MKPIAQGLGLVLTSCSWLLAQEKPAPPAVPAPASKPAPVATPQAPAAPAAPSPVAKPEAEAPKEIVVQLPAPSFKGSLSVEEGFNTRRSVREFTTDTLKLKDLAQILWAGQGVTMQKEKAPKQWLPKYEYQGGYRTTPSAGGLFPIELYLLAGNVEGLPAGVYKYHPGRTP